MKRTSIKDIDKVSSANELEELVQDKRARFRANRTKARRRQRRYQNLLTRELKYSSVDSLEYD